MTEQPSDRCYSQIFLIPFIKGKSGDKGKLMLPMELSFRKLLAPFLQGISALSVSCKCLVQFLSLYWIFGRAQDLCVVVGFLDST